MPQIIDGQRVVVNETTYSKTTQFGTSIYKVRTVEVMDEDAGEKDANNNDRVPVPVTEQQPPFAAVPTAGAERETEADDLERGSPEVLDKENRIPNEINREVEVQ